MSFLSILDAINCAKELQEIFQQEPKIPLRIGVHLSDIMYAENDIYGQMSIYAFLGENDLALNVMAIMLSKPCQFHGLWFSANPEFAGLRDNPETKGRFNDLMKMSGSTSTLKN